MAVVLTGWYVGYVIASAVILVVVALIGWILSLARRIGVQSQRIAGTVAEIRSTTAPIPTVKTLNEKLVHVVEQASAARVALIGED